MQALADISRSALCCQQGNSCTNCKSAQKCTTRGHPQSFPQVAFGSVQQWRNAARDRQTDRQ